MGRRSLLIPHQRQFVSDQRVIDYGQALHMVLRMVVGVRMLRWLPYCIGPMQISSGLGRAELGLHANKHYPDVLFRP